MIRSRRLLASLGIFVTAAAAQAALPTNDEQYFLEMTNRMRLNPQAELKILTNIIGTTPSAVWGTPKSSDDQVDNALQFFATDANTLLTQWNSLVPAPALAWNSNISDAAIYHGNQVLDHRFEPFNPDGSGGPQQHVFTGEPSLGPRLTTAGYTFTAGAENLYAYSKNNFYGHAGFAIDWGPNAPSGIQNPPGHRNNIMNATYRETGLTILPETYPGSPIGPSIINMDFGRRSGDAFLTGVVYNDSIELNHFYTPGEGLGGITIRVFNAGTTAQRFLLNTWASGGYVQQLPAGTYDIKLSGAGLPSDIVYNGVVMGSNNVKIDTLTNWLPAAGGNWTSAANWNAGIPNGVGTRAFLSSYTGSGGTITVNSPITVGSIDIENSSPYTISGTGSLNLHVTAGQSQIYVSGLGHTIATPVILSDDTAMNIDGSLALTGGLQNPAGKAITSSGLGTLTIAGPQSHAANSSLSIGSGTVILQSNAGTPASASAAATANLAIDVSGPGAKLTLEADQNLRSLIVAQSFADLQSVDLKGHSLHIYSSTLASTKTSLYAAIRNAAASPLDGIFDSTIGFHLNARIGLGIVPDAHGDSQLLIRPTRIGDVNLDGSVTIADFIDLSAHFNLLGTATWQEGDVNADGNVTIADFIELASNFNTSYSGEIFPISNADQQTLARFAASIGAAVPEPSALFALGGLALLSTRRRKR